MRVYSDCHNKRSTHTKRPWFGIRHKHLRTKYLKAKTIYAGKKATHNKMRLINASKWYKKSILKKNSQHKFKTESKMRRLLSDDPKVFYELFNKKQNIFDNNVNVPPIDTFVYYSSDLNKREPNNDNVFDFNMDEVLYEVNNPSTINKIISADEIMEAIKQLKYHKAAGVDRVVDEYIKSTTTLLMPVYVKRFNTIFDNGVLPDEWHTGIIIPIFKNEGSRLHPEHYRPITLLCCCSKLFTTLLNNRLSLFIEEHNTTSEEHNTISEEHNTISEEHNTISEEHNTTSEEHNTISEEHNTISEEHNTISEAQTAFRKGYSTLDHIFFFYITSLNKYLEKRKKKLYCVFVDFGKAFDTVPRMQL